MATPTARSRKLQQLVNTVPKWPVYWLGAAPGVWIFWLAFNDRLGADPVKALEHFLGLWGLRFIIIGLAITPLRRFGGPSLVRYRRAIGLLAFFYVLAHLNVYMVLDRGLDGGAILKDILKRPYITIGMFAFAILIPLAVTSNNASIKRLGTAWSKLHKWVYVAAIAASVHFLMSVKSWPPEPVIYATLIAVLLSIRVALALKKRFYPSARVVAR